MVAVLQMAVLQGKLSVAAFPHLSRVHDRGQARVRQGMGIGDYKSLPGYSFWDCFHNLMARGCASPAKSIKQRQDQEISNADS
jgi:hypothetical protein